MCVNENRYCHRCRSTQVMEVTGEYLDNEVTKIYAKTFTCTKCGKQAQVLTAWHPEPGANLWRTG